MGHREEVPSFLPFSFIPGDAQLQIRMPVHGSGTGWSEDTEVSGAWNLHIFITILKKNKFKNIDRKSDARINAYLEEKANI